MGSSAAPMPEPSSSVQPSPALPPASNVAPLRCRARRRQPPATPAHARALPIRAGARRLSLSRPQQFRLRLSTSSWEKLIPSCRHGQRQFLRLPLGKTSTVGGRAVVGGDLESTPGFVLLPLDHPVVKPGPLRIAGVKRGKLPRPGPPPRLGGLSLLKRRRTLANSPRQLDNEPP